jgi:hypothetical protein
MARGAFGYPTFEEGGAGPLDANSSSSRVLQIARVVKPPKANPSARTRLAASKSVTIVCLFVTTTALTLFQAKALAAGCRYHLAEQLPGGAVEPLQLHPLDRREIGRLKRLEKTAYELDAFKPNLTRAEAGLRIAALTAKLKLLDGPPHTL